MIRIEAIWLALGAGQPEEARTHDFIDEQLGKVAPYGVYDVSANEGWVSVGPMPASRPSGFVAARVAARVASSAASTSVRVELNAGGARLDLHWPLAHTRELAALLREFSR